MAPSAEDLLVQLNHGDIIAWRFLSFFHFSFFFLLKMRIDHLIL